MINNRVLCIFKHLLRQKYKYVFYFIYILIRVCRIYFL